MNIKKDINIKEDISNSHPNHSIVICAVCSWVHLKSVSFLLFLLNYSMNFMVLDKFLFQVEFQTDLSLKKRIVLYTISYKAV